MPAKTRSQIEPAVQSQRLAALRDVRQVILAHLAEEALLTHLGENPMGAPDGSVSEMNRAALASRDTLRSVPGDCFHTLCALGEFASACVLATRVGEQAAKSFLVACSGARNSAQQRKLQAEWRAVHGAPEATEAAPAPPPKVVVPRKPLKPTDPSKEYQIRDGAKGRWLGQRGNGVFGFTRSHQPGSAIYAGGPKLDAFLVDNPNAVPHLARDFKNGSTRYFGKAR